MKKWILCVSTILWLGTGCQNTDDIDIYIRVKNSSDTYYVKVELYGYAPGLVYENIPADSISEYGPYDSRMMPDTYFIITSTDTLNVIYEFAPTDSGLENGMYTMELDGTQLLDFKKD